MSAENPNAYIAELMEQVIEYGISGPGATIMLFQAGLGLEEVEQTLREAGFQAVADKQKGDISVSIERFTGTTHPIVPEHYETKTVPLESKDGKGWLSEVE